MQQLNFFQKKERVCAFTGHRVLGEDFDAELLREKIKEKIDGGVSVFLSGMATGFDLLAAELVLAYKVELPHVKLIACTPCENQDKYYSKEDKTRYRTIILTADEVVTLSDKYYPGCMQRRNEYMVKRADCLLTYCRKKEGGTAYTVRYFQKQHPEGEICFL